MLRQEDWFLPEGPRTSEVGRCGSKAPDERSDLKKLCGCRVSARPVWGQTAVGSDRGEVLSHQAEPRRGRLAASADQRACAAPTDGTHQGSPADRAARCAGFGCWRRGRLGVIRCSGRHAWRAREGPAVPPVLAWELAGTVSLSGRTSPFDRNPEGDETLVKSSLQNPWH